MSRPVSRLLRARSGALAAFAALLVAAPTVAAERPPADFFTLVDGAPLVVTATVSGRSENVAFGIVIYELVIRQALKGTPPAASLTVVQDLVFPSDRPMFDREQEWLLALEPLPSSSRYHSLPQGGTHFRVRDGRRGARPVDALSAVERYLAVDREAPQKQRRERIGALVAALWSAPLGEDALRALAAHPTLAKDLTGAHAALFATALADEDLPLEQRRALLRLVEEKHLSALLTAVRPLLDEPELAPFARRLLASFGEVPAPDELRADLQLADSAARQAALEAAQTLPQTERLPLLADVAKENDEYDVRVAAIDVLSRVGRPAVPALAALLDDEDGRITYKAARGLAAAGGPEAVDALSSTFAGTNYDAQVAAVFALRDIGTQDAMRVLRALRADPPDPRLEKVLDVALGGGGHHH
jgi:hypothetical protein